MLINPELTVQTEMKHRLERLPSPDSDGQTGRVTRVRGSWRRAGRR